MVLYEYEKGSTLKSWLKYKTIISSVRIYTLDERAYADRLYFTVYFTTTAVNTNENRILAVVLPTVCH